MKKFVIVIVDKLNVRDAPNGNEIGVLRKGDCFEVLAKFGVQGVRWVRIPWPAPQQAWIAVQNMVTLEQYATVEMPAEPALEPIPGWTPRDPEQQPLVHLPFWLEHFWKAVWTLGGAIVSALLGYLAWVLW